MSVSRWRPAPARRDPGEIAGLEMIGLFRGLPADDLALLNDVLHRKDFPAGANIITAEQPGEVIYIILSGTVKIHVEQPDGGDVVIAILGPGDTVGEMSLVDSASRSASVVTQEPSTLLWMDRTTFRQCLRTLPSLTDNLVVLLAARVRMANEQIQALAALDVYGRVARQLLAFAERYGRPRPDGQVLLPLRLTQSDLAGLVGASRERVNQAMMSFKRRRMIAVDRRFYITILNPEALARHCR